MSLMDRKVILASASPRRVELLQSEFGVEHEVIPADVDEESVVGDTMEETAMKRAELKLSTVLKRISDEKEAIVIAVDNVVDFNGEIIGKPVVPSKQRDMLLAFSGKRHRAIAGIALYDCATGQLLNDVAVAEIDVMDLSEKQKEMEYYIDSGKGLYSAGGYDYRGDDLEWMIAAVRGSRSAIRGLPVELLRKMLKKLEG